MDKLERVKAWIAALTDIGLMLLGLSIAAALLVGTNLPFFFSFAFLQSSTTWIYLFNICLITAVAYFRIAKFGIGPLGEIESETTVEMFLAKMLRRSLLAPALLSLLSCVLAYFGEDRAATFASTMAAVILGHCFITQYRVGRGLFGTNEQEAVELIGFMVRHAQDTGTPPGSRLSKAFSPSVVGQKVLGPNAPGVVR